MPKYKDSEVWGKFSFDPSMVEIVQQICACTHNVFEHNIDSDNNATSCRTCACEKYQEVVKEN